MLHDSGVGYKTADHTYLLTCYISATILVVVVVIHFVAHRYYLRDEAASFAKQ